MLSLVIDVQIQVLL